MSRDEFLRDEDAADAVRVLVEALDTYSLDPSYEPTDAVSEAMACLRHCKPLAYVAVPRLLHRIRMSHEEAHARQIQ